MKTQNKWLLAVMSAAALAACGGGSSDTAEPAAGGATLAEVKYSTGCVVSTYIGQAIKVDIALTGALSTTPATATVEYQSFSDPACANRAQRVYAKGPVVLTGDSKTLKAGSQIKTGQKGQFTVVDLNLSGISLSPSPINQALNFVIVDEGDKLYFGKGSRAADGYPSELSSMTATKL